MLLDLCNLETGKITSREERVSPKSAPTTNGSDKAIVRNRARRANWAWSSAAQSYDWIEEHGGLSSFE
jgi:hypothetical protein